MRALEPDHPSPRLRPAVPSICLLTSLLVLGACDGAKDEPARSDVKAAAARKEEGSSKAPADAKAAPAGRVWFVAPADGAKVGRKLDVEFGVEGKTVQPAAGTERDPLIGHHHIIIDGKPIPDMQVVPKDEKHLHYGDGSTRTTLLLPPGKHQLTMQFADGLHQSYGPDWAQTITVEVEAEADAKAEGDAEAAGDAKAEADAG